VERFIDRASAVLNLAMRQAGPGTPITNTTAKPVCDDWVTARAVEYVELTQRGTGYDASEGSRTGAFRSLYSAAADFVAANLEGFKRVGVPVQQRSSQGVTFTGLAAQGQRADPRDSGLEQPLFRRGQFDRDV